MLSNIFNSKSFFSILKKILFLNYKIILESKLYSIYQQEEGISTALKLSSMIKLHHADEKTSY